jgi:hypothetical protein
VIGVTELIDAEDPDLGIVIDFGSWVISLMDLRNEVEGSDTGGGIAAENRFVADGGADMRFPQAGVSDEDQVEGLFDPRRVDEGEDLLLADFRIKKPIELVQSLNLF